MSGSGSFPSAPRPNWNSGLPPTATREACRMPCWGSSFLLGILIPTKRLIFYSIGDFPPPSDPVPCLELVRIFLSLDASESFTLYLSWYINIALTSTQLLDKNTCHFKWKIKSWQILYFISTNYIQIHIVLQKKKPTKILIGKFNVIFKGNSMTRSISGVIMTDGQSTNPYKLEDVLMMVKLRGIEIFSIGKLEFQASSLTLNYCVRRNLYG